MKNKWTGRAIKRYPVLFKSYEMPYILDGTLTQAERMIRGVPKGVVEFVPQLLGKFIGIDNIREDTLWSGRCPFGEKGDLLWLRETWGIIDNDKQTLEGFPLFEYEEPDCDGTEEERAFAGMDGHMRLSPGYSLVYKADGKEYDKGILGKYRGKWRAPMHLPMWAARIWFEVTGVSTERYRESEETIIWMWVIDFKRRNNE